MRIVIIQPHFIPFIGYFDLMKRCDLFVYYDSAQYVKRSWHSRVYLPTNGVAQWISGSVDLTKGSRKPICEMKWSNNCDWRNKVSNKIEHLYGKTKTLSFLEKLLNHVQNGTADLGKWNIQMNSIIAETLNITTPVALTSMLKPTIGNKEEKILQICKELGANEYLCGPGSKLYINENTFAINGIRICWHDYSYQTKLKNRNGKYVFPSIIHPILSTGIDVVLPYLNRQLNEVSL